MGTRTRGAAVVPVEATRTPFAVTSPVIYADMESRYAAFKRAHHRPVALLHETFGGIHPEAAKFFEECATNTTALGVS